MITAKEALRLSMTIGDPDRVFLIITSKIKEAVKEGRQSVVVRISKHLYCDTAVRFAVDELIKNGFFCIPKFQDEIEADHEIEVRW